MKWCIRCGQWFTPRGRVVKRSASLRGQFHEPEDTICDSCIKPIDMQMEMEGDDERSFPL